MTLYTCLTSYPYTIVKAFSNVGTLKNDNYARTWLIRILINECYSLVRKSSKFIPLENLADRQEPESEKTKNYSELYTAVNSLKEELRLPVILYYIEDFSVKEIAQILEISEGAVQKRLARARGKLRQELQEVINMRLEDMKNDIPETPDFIHNMIQNEVAKQLADNKVANCEEENDGQLRKLPQWQLRVHWQFPRQYMQE